MMFGSAALLVLLALGMPVRALADIMFTDAPVIEGTEVTSVAITSKPEEQQERVTIFFHPESAVYRLCMEVKYNNSNGSGTKRCGEKRNIREWVSGKWNTVHINEPGSDGYYRYEARLFGERGDSPLSVVTFALERRG